MMNVAQKCKPPHGLCSIKIPCIEEATELPSRFGCESRSAAGFVVVSRDRGVTMLFLRLFASHKAEDPCLHEAGVPATIMRKNDILMHVIVGVDRSNILQ